MTRRFSLLRRWIGDGPGARFVTVLAGGTALGQGAVLLVTPVISRLYTRAEIGTFGLFLAFLSVASVVATGRYEFAIPGAATEDEADNLLVIGLFLSTLVSGAGGVVLWAMIRRNLLSFGALPEWAALALVPALLAFGAFSILRYWFVRHKRFKDIGGILIVQGIGRAGVPIVLGLLGTGVLGLILGEIAGRLAGVGGMLRGARHSIVSAARRFRDLPRTARRNWKYPGILLPSGLADVMALALPVPLVASAYGQTAAGVLVLVQRLTTAPASLLGTSVGDVFHASVARLAVAGPEATRAYLDRTAIRLLGIGALILIPAAIAAPLLLPLVLGHGWEDAGKMFVVLAPWSLAAFVVVPVSRALFVSDKKELKIVYDCIALGALVGTISYAHHAAWGFYHAMAVVSAGQTGAYLIYYALLRVAAGHLELGGRAL